jgi:putative nucleotidyltransferase with HDIG domain
MTIHTGAAGPGTSGPSREKLARTARALEVNELPVLPGVVVRLMALSPQTERLFEEVLTIASEDPALALRVIRTANSPFSAPRSPVETIEAAIARLGANHVAELVTTVAIARVFVPTSAGETELWLHAIEVATACRAIVEHLHVDGVTAEHAYLAGLLHDIGRFILFDQAPDFIRAVDDLAWTTPQELVEAERQVCGIDHAELGSRVCAHWDVPESIRGVVQDHHRELNDMSDASRPLLGTVKIADWLSIWHRTHELGRDDDVAEAMAQSLPSITIAGVHNATIVTATELARILPEVLAARTRAIRDLGLVVH